MIRAAGIFLALTLATSAAVDASRLADALRIREGYRGIDGRQGERGPWQLMEITWNQQMPGIPFAAARQEGPARACALKHIAWLVTQLEARGVTATPYNIAAAWNAGLTRYLSGQAPVRAYLYAADVERLYQLGADESPASLVTAPRPARVLSDRSPANPVALYGVCLPSTH